MKILLIKKSITEKLNSLFVTTLYTNLAAKLPHSTSNFHLPNITTIFQENCLTPKEFKNTFCSLKTNKSPGYHSKHVNVIRNLYNKLKTPLMNIFNLTLNTGFYPGRIKVAKLLQSLKKVKNLAFQIISQYLLHLVF